MTQNFSTVGKISNVLMHLNPGIMNFDSYSRAFFSFKKYNCICLPSVSALRFHSTESKHFFQNTDFFCVRFFRRQINFRRTIYAVGWHEISQKFQSARLCAIRESGKEMHHAAQFGKALERAFSQNWRLKFVMYDVRCLIQRQIEKQLENVNDKIPDRSASEWAG